MGLGVSKLEAKINNTATAGIWGRYEAGQDKVVAIQMGKIVRI